MKTELLSPKTQQVEMKIMIVDDSKFGRGMIHSYLKTVFTEAEFIPAQSGYDALEKIEDSISNNGTWIDLIFLDYLMPDMDGISVAEKVLEKHKEALIIMITSNLQTPVREKAQEVGIKAFFNKPLKKTDLLEIRQLWENTPH